MGRFFAKNFFRRKRKDPTGSKKTTPSRRDTLIKHGIGQRRKGQRHLIVEKPDIILSEKAQRILDSIESSSKNIFLTGRAGTGKSTLLRYFRATTKKNTVFLAPTGVAAVNIQGQTVHSFFKFLPGITEDKVKRTRGKRVKIYKNIDIIVIDEVSMVRVDLFDCVDKFLRLNGPDPKKPFGGIQMVVVGDVYQLPPVVPNDEKALFETYYKSPYFFDSKNYIAAKFSNFELTEVYRQSDEEFIEILDAIRTCNISEEHISRINQQLTENENDHENNFHISLVPTNVMADNINIRRLNEIRGVEKVYEGDIEGEFRDRNLPTAQKLTLKEGAQIMLLNNDPKGRWINGDIARVVRLDIMSVRVVFEDGSFDDIGNFKWEMIRFVYDEAEGKIQSEIVGSFTQIPIRLAWAVTIHKGQGKTFDRVIIDFGSGTFASGQAYVALSRCRSLGGLLLKSPLEEHHIFIDRRVDEFMKGLEKGIRKKADKKMP